MVRAAVELGLEDGTKLRVDTTRMTARQRHEQQTHTYRVLIDIAEEVVGNARAGLERTRTMRGRLPKQISFFHDGLLLRSHLSGVFTYEAFADWARLSVH